MAGGEIYFKNLGKGADTHRLQILKQTYLRWEPKEDITTYELALCTPIIAMALAGNYVGANSAVESLPDGAKRHFVDVS